MVEKKKKRASITSYDPADARPSAKSQLRRRFDFGGESSEVTSPNVLARETARPAAQAHDPDAEPASRRPTIPTPGPRLSLACIPRRIVADDAMMALPLDHRTAFVLMQIDGKTNLRTLIDVTSLVPEELVTLVERLLDLRAIALT